MVFTKFHQNGIDSTNDKTDKNPYQKTQSASSETNKKKMGIKTCVQNCSSSNHSCAINNSSNHKSELSSEACEGQLKMNVSSTSCDQTAKMREKCVYTDSLNRSKSFGDEVQSWIISLFTFDLETISSRLKKIIITSLESVIPDWLSEPEFMIFPKPQVDKTVIHSHADSLFSTSSGFTNYYGILNLCFILLVLGNARLFLENIIKYGILINYSYLAEWFLREPYNWPNLLLTVSIVIFPAIALCTEKLLAKGKISNSVGVVIYIINLTVLLLFPAGVIYYLHPVIVFSIFTLGNVTICFLKLISYAHVNYWCRENYANKRLKRRSSSGNIADDQSANNAVSKTLQSYPDNLNVRDLAYFMFAPTLCYELNFPRSARIRKRFLAKRVIEMVFLTWLMVALMQQWIVPAVNNARQPLEEMEIFKMLERLLKLAIPNHLIWLIWFYCFFHSTLNVVAELLRFGDRVFYKDWWNAETVSEFWQHWNIPVHRFAARHIYKPLLNKGFSRLMASTIVFLLSAFFHEYLVSIPLRMFKIWAFMGMAMQVPIAYITSKFVRGKWGNITMWLSLILGQPVAILAYFHDYYVVHSLPLHTNSTT
uniref:O-acyltransferase n=1 Tax=Biomphalaria glabrata TaxID=6526 RepID=A0A2C9K594_BIOGL